MASSQERYDEIFASYGLHRGRGDNVGYTLRSATLHGGSIIEFEPNGITAIAGANNSGKSTLLAQLGEKIHGAVMPQPPLLADISDELVGEPSDYIDWLSTNAALIEEYPGQGLTFRRLGHQIPLSAFNGSQYVPGLGGDSVQGQQMKALLVRQMGAAERDVSGVSRKNSVLEPPTHPFHHLAEDAELLSELNRLTQKILGKTLSLDDLNNLIELRVGVTDIPYPQRFDDPAEYQEALNRLPTLATQGDGMRSLLSILIPLVTASFKIFIIDEPEAFLHPPQSFALGQELGRISADQGTQIILATHDRNLLAGLLNSNAPLSVVRLVRNDLTTKAHQLKSDDLKTIWDDPVLKYSNVLDGLFHQLVIMAENERDCRFYEAALDVAADNEHAHGNYVLPATDVLFIPTGGTGGMSKVARALRALEVPIIACPDLDVLDNEAVMKGIVEALGHTWDGLREDWRTTTQHLGGSQELELISAVYLRLENRIKQILEADPLARLDAANRRSIKESLGISQRPWDEVKNNGVRVLERVSGNPDAVHRLLNGLAERQVVVVHEGQLESFGYRLPVQKGKGWLPAALTADLQSSEEVQQHIRRIILAAQPILEG